MTRALATIRIVDQVIPIPGADFIELVKIDGWQCVVKKGDFKPGDTCVYFEIDSYLPIHPRYEFLRKSSYKRIKEALDGQRSEGYRLRTAKLRGQISQGLALPLDAFYDDFPEWKDLDFRDNLDVTALLDVEKYDPPIPACLAGEALGYFPSCIPRTDEERIQNLPEYFDMYQDMEFEITEKLDGTSMTVYRKDDHFGVCSRNLELLETKGNTLWRVARELDLETDLEDMGRNLALQGELIGEGIQGNPYKIKGHRFCVFNIWDIDRQSYFNTEERIDLLESGVFTLGGVRHVPQIAIGEILKDFPTVEDLLWAAEGISILNSKIPREGLVFKSIDDPGNVHFKAINNQYLLKGE